MDRKYPGRRLKLSNSNSDYHALAESGYTIGRKIGKGAFGLVILCKVTEPDGKVRQLACKIIDKAKLDKKFVEKYIPRELEILTIVQHPNIIQIHSIVMREPKIFIFMQYAEKGDLLTYIMDSGPIDENLAKYWFRQMAEALKYLHDNEIAHRDIKCENILLDKSYNCKLADFSFARYCCNDSGRNVKSDTYCGSNTYACPQIIKNVPYDPKMADAWSLGVTLFVMLNGNTPFNFSNVTQMLVGQYGRQYKFASDVTKVLSHNAKSTVWVLLEPCEFRRWNMDEILNCKWLMPCPEMSSTSDSSM